MRKLFVFLPVIFFLCSCAIQAPMVTKYYVSVDNTDKDYQSYCNLIDLSRLSNADKALAKQLIKEQFDFKKSIISFSNANDSVIKVNRKKTSHYSVANSWVGGLGGLSSLATIWASWTVVVPVVSGVWNLFGLSIQTYNLNPEIEISNKNKEKVEVVNVKFNESKEKFQLMISASSKSDADKYFTDWKKDLNSALIDASNLFGISLLKFDNN
jgi:hypothetical protein